VRWAPRPGAARGPRWGGGRGSRELPLGRPRLSRRRTGTEEDWAARAGEDSGEADAEEPYLQLPTSTHGKLSAAANGASTQADVKRDGPKQTIWVAGCGKLSGREWTGPNNWASKLPRMKKQMFRPERCAQSSVPACRPFVSRCNNSGVSCNNHEPWCHSVLPTPWPGYIRPQNLNPCSLIRSSTLHIKHRLLNRNPRGIGRQEGIEGVRPHRIRP
jgi:hypothetical protein